MAAAANNIGNNVIDGHEDDDFLWDDDDDDEPIVDSRALSETWKANSNFCRGAAKVGIVRSFFVISDIASFVSSGDNVQTTLFKVGGFRWRFNVNIFEDEEPSIYSAYLGRIIGGNTNAVRRIREYASLTLSKKPMSRAIVIGFEAWVVAADGHRVRLSSMAEVGAGELWLLEGKTATLGIDRFIAVRDIDAATSAAAGLVDSDGRLTIGFRMFWIENRTMKLGSRWQDPDGSDEDEKSVQTKLSHDEPMSRDDFADVILVSACGKEFNAHKAVLASRSPIFAEMIRSANSSGGQARPAADQSDQIKLAVPNLDSETIEAILNYMYNVVSDPVVGRAYWTAIEQRKHQVQFVTPLLADRLLSAAEAYQMPRLRSLVELHLIAEIGIDTVADILAFAERRSMPSDSPLRRAAVRTLTNNVIEVASTPGWVRLIMDHPQLAAEFLRRATNVRPSENDDDLDDDVDDETMPPPAKRTKNK